MCITPLSTPMPWKESRQTEECIKSHLLALLTMVDRREPEIDK